MGVEVLKNNSERLGIRPLRGAGLWCLAALISLAVGMPATAQTDRGTITGTVTDSAGAVMVGVPIRTSNVDTGFNYETVTSSTGNYALPSLPVGNYEVVVEAEGFNRFVRQGIRIQTAQIARIDISLTVGSVTESITITADAPLLRTENAEQSQTITGDKINSLPIQLSTGPRNPIASVLLAPGVVTTPGSTAVRINGSQNSTYKILLDGQDITQTGSSTQRITEAQPSVEALQEVTLQSSNYAAEYGQVAGGMINMTSRSGTNELHGSAYEFLRNEFLNAGRPYTNDGQGNLIRPLARNHNYGFTVGGPVKIPGLYNGQNRTFFFFNLEAFRTNTVNAGIFGTVPTAAYRAGDFGTARTGRQLSTALGTYEEGTIFNPSTDRTVDGKQLRDPFANNIVPTPQLDPVALKIQGLIPTATEPGLINNQAISEETQRRTWIPMLKLDHNFNDKLKMSFYWSSFISDVPKNNPDGLPWPISRGRTYIDRTPTIRLTADYVVTPTVIVHLGAGVIRYDHTDSAPAAVLEYDAVGQLGLRGSSTDPAGFPRLTGLYGAQGGYGLQNFQGGVGTLGPLNANRYTETKPTAVASTTVIRGNHTYKFGGEWASNRWSDQNTRGAQGIYNFDPAQTAIPALGATNVGGGTLGFNYASFLLGHSSDASVANPQDPQIRKGNTSFYVQDTWKVSSRVTLDYGLRYDYTNVWREVHDRQASFDPLVANPSAGGRPGGTIYEGYGPGRCDCVFGEAYKWGFGPRLGLAYQVNDKTVIRAGWGIVMGQTASGGYVTNGQIVGVGYNTKLYNDSFGFPGAVLEDGLSWTRSELYDATLDPGVLPSNGVPSNHPVFYDRSSGRPPRVNQWNISLQRSITENLSVEVAYLGNRGVWLQSDNMVQQNAMTIGAISAAGFDIANAADRTILVSPWSSPAAQARGVKAPYANFPTNQSTIQALRPFPQFNGTQTGIRTRWNMSGNSWYDALQMKLTKRTSHGLDVSGSFTWSKTTMIGADGTVNDIYDRESNKFLSAGDTPLILTVGFTYLTPAATGNRFFRSLTRDWNFGGVMSYTSGALIRVPQAQNNLANYLFRGTYANRVDGEPLFLKDLNGGDVDPNKDFVLNPAAWSDPAQGAWGNFGGYYDDFRQRRRPVEQLGVGRTFRFKERMSFELRGEFFNVFNRTQMGNPDATNALATQRRSAAGVPTAGFGRINSAVLGGDPRSGHLLLRIQF